MLSLWPMSVLLLSLSINPANRTYSYSCAANLYAKTGIGSTTPDRHSDPFLPGPHLNDAKPPERLIPATCWLSSKQGSLAMIFVQGCASDDHVKRTPKSPLMSAVAASAGTVRHTTTRQAITTQDWNRPLQRRASLHNCTRFVVTHLPMFVETILLSLTAQHG